METKSVLKKIVPRDIWKLGWTFKENIKRLHQTSADAHPFGNSFSSFVNAAKAALKENTEVVGLLDFPDSKILMNAESGREIYRLASCRKEPETVAWIKTYMQPSDTFYDIGANVGAYSLVAFAIAGGHGRIYSFEPGFATFNALCRNIFLNASSEKIVPLQVALASTTRTYQFNYTHLGSGHAMHTLGDQKTSSWAHQILGFSLDDFIQQFHIPPPSLMKIDVDGGELDVLTGARSTLLLPSLRSVLVEVDKRLNAEVHRLMDQAGFLRQAHYTRMKGRAANCIYVKK